MPRLRRSDTNAAGIRRRRAGRGFYYVDAAGARLTDEGILQRIHELAIPPAWEDVWICPWPNGHIQATGLDAKGRRQYRYHDVWRANQDRAKFERMVEFGRVVPHVREVCRAHLGLDGMPRERALACGVCLLDIGLFRIGTEEYAEENGTFGVATLLREHVRVAGDEIIFDFPGKTGKEHVRSIADRDVREAVRVLKRRRSGGPELLAYRDGGAWIDVRSRDINDYLREHAGADVTAKDFRTWNATVLAAASIARTPLAPTSVTRRRREMRRVVCEVAEQLGNTPAVCRTSYIDPRVFDLYLDGTTIAPALARINGRVSGARAREVIEAAVIELLESEEARAAA